MTLEQVALPAWTRSRTWRSGREAGSPEVSSTIAFLKTHGTVMDPTQSWNERSDTRRARR
ncbi:MAG: hypothetical protein R2712_09095 [Vicinamibacterales bacterium]